MESKRSDPGRKGEAEAVDPLDREKEECLSKLDVVANYLIDYTDICEHGPESVSRVVRRKKKVRVQDDAGQAGSSTSDEKKEKDRGLKKAAGKDTKGKDAKAAKRNWQAGGQRKEREEGNQEQALNALEVGHVLFLTLLF